MAVTYSQQLFDNAVNQPALPSIALKPGASKTATNASQHCLQILGPVMTPVTGTLDAQARPLTRLRSKGQVEGNSLNQSTQSDSLASDVYLVHELRAHRLAKDKSDEYLVKWQDCASDENTWEPLRNITANAVEEYQQKHAINAVDAPWAVSMLPLKKRKIHST